MTMDKVFETVDVTDASIKQFFAEAGTPVGRAFAYAEDKVGLLNRVGRALDLVEATSRGDVGINRLAEAMGTSDFPLLMGVALEQVMVGAYKSWPTSYRDWAMVSTVPDFRDAARYEVAGGDGTLPEVGQQSEYPATTLTESKATFRVKKYGTRIPLSWEMIRNDAMGAFADIPKRFGRAAARTEEKFATSLIVGASGPDSTLYSSAHSNLLTEPLSVAGVQAGFAAMSEMTDAGGEPILNRPTVLAVPPALEVTANNIVNALTIKAKLTGGGSSEQEIETANWIKAGGLKPVVLPYAPIIASTANGSTQWYLFADPAERRAAVEVAHLRGHEAPAIFMKSPNAVGLSGTAASAFDGDFDTDSIQYKVRAVFGGRQGDYRFTVGSTGAGSAGAGSS